MNGHRPERGNPIREQNPAYGLLQPIFQFKHPRNDSFLLAAGMNSLLNIPVQIFSAAYSDHVFLVGGYVRDLLLGRQNQDIDMVVALSHGELSNLGFRLVEASSSVNVYCRHHPEFGKIEVTRIDSVADLAIDLTGRDFTINAMAMDMKGALIDPLSGRKDLEAGILRPCSHDSFRNDPLRIIRAFRFEAGGWTMMSETELLIREQKWSASFAAMPVERFSSEMLKALTLQAPERFFQLMIDYQVGKEFLPELFLMPAIPAGPLEHHPEGDLFTHSVQVLQRVARVSSNPLARFCAFFHDLGKLGTDPMLHPKHHGHDTLGFSMAAEFCSRLRLPAVYAKALAWVSRLHGKANRWNELRDATRITMAEQALKAGVGEILPLISAADKPGALQVPEWDKASEIAGMNTREMGMDQEKLNSMPVEDRQSCILQRRVELLKRRSNPEQREQLHG